MARNQIMMSKSDKEEILKKIESVISTHKDVVNALGKHHVFEDSTDSVTTLQNEILEDDKHKIDHVKIICYGRSGYGNIVKKLPGKEITYEIIICAEEAVKRVGKTEDIDAIKTWIRKWNDTGAVKIYASRIPPSIRASLFYYKNKPVWGTIQSYQFTMENDAVTGKQRLIISKPVKSLISVCDKKTSLASDFESLVECFENEFDRLLLDKTEVRIEESGEIHF